MDRQKVFTKVKNHLLNQGEKCIDKLGRCVYRGPNGMKCALGALIKDAEYTKNMEHIGINYSSKKFDPFLKRIKVNSKRDFEFLTSLQYIHDNFEATEWPYMLRTFAKNRRLKYNG